MLREAKPEDAAVVNAIIASEIAAYEKEIGQPSGFAAPGEGAIEMSIRDGDVIWIEEPRRVAWAHPDDPVSPMRVFIMHAWAPSEVHADHLEEVCDVAIARGWRMVEFPATTIADTPIMRIVRDKFMRPDQQAAGRIWRTTFQEAKARYAELGN